jgi:N-formylmaleamate deformylase
VNGWQEGDIETNGIRLHYTRTGGDKPALVMAHGVTDGGLCWAPVAQALAADYDVIMVDARAHGLSQETEGGFDPATQAEDLAGLVTGLGLTKPAILGHSMGAATAMTLAGTYPDLPGAILLEDPPSWWTDWYETAEAGDRVGQMRESLITRKAMSREELLADQREREPAWTDDELQPWADAKQRVSLNVVSVFDRSNPNTVDWAATLSRITCPTLLLISDPELGGIVTAEDGASLKALVPQAEVVHIPEAGHSIRRDQFQPYVDAVRSFLDAHVPALR